MPEIKWSEMNEIVHNVKNILTRMVKIELLCKRMKEDASSELNKLETIILRAAEDE